VFRRVAEARRPAEDTNTLEGSRANIHRHYDLSNDLFATFLDETMSYSSAWFADGSDDLADAQRRKIDGVLDMAGVRDGMHVLEIGTGWGELASRAARRGARVTSLTLSAEQATLAEQRLAAAGVADRVQVLLRDYREAQGSYDAVVSVEMVEAVGMAYWPTYFAALDRLLRPGGRIGLQAITMPHDRMLAARNDHSWISKYIFPGGLIPSVTAIEDNVGEHTGLRIAERRSLGPDYARTLAHWRHTFLERWEDVAALGFDSTFRRMWEFYLAYCEAGFRAGAIGVSQLGLARHPFS
jgi:cyclopropane-fatty-acyl-phospholipid synthase